MSNSKLISYTKISPNKNSPRNKPISKITIHHMAGKMSAKACVDMFANPARKGSCNYAIGYNGEIALGVDEKDRSWCSSSSANDNMAITIEVSNEEPNSGPNWRVSDTCIKSLINLCVDICKRNSIEKLNYTGNANGNVTIHQFFAATACPGHYLKSKIPYIIEQVNKQLSEDSAPSPTTDLYRVRKTWADASSQLGAYESLENAIDACPQGYNVYNSKGKEVYSNDGVKQLYRVRKSWNNTTSQLGAYEELENAINDCPKGYNVYDSNGKQVYSNPVATPTSVDVYYKTYAKGKWWSEIKNTNDKNTSGFAGVEGSPLQAITMKTSKGKIRYRVHVLGGKWLNWIDDYGTSKTKDYAGIKGKNIDMIQIDFSGISGFKAKYRVSTTHSSSYLDWIENYNNNNTIGYAGIKGQPIDKIQIKISK